MTVLPRFTSSDLALMPEDGKRYEVIDGDLHVPHQPKWHHQFAASRLYRFLDEWSEATGLQAPRLLGRASGAEHEYSWLR
ncbi:hypothetical protein [Thermostichus vulcanus]|uniref:Restriction endonuclease domain-containing protein n=1 Tax=Thermostichus vulcanus str. 'Rupite' TaxID=2813851 RepID=A0ABT0CDN6_THEVL|nr:hypothetical protein [Thermostichus vulcanus]MCJ2543886.1 hypothetical protein [Thermostichus vulcanus str. 'Rupite']